VSTLCSMTRLGKAGSLLCLALLAAGCSSNGSVSGKVTFNGAPMPGGTVTFVPEGGGAGGGSASINPEDGSYSIDKLPKGPMKVTVKAYTPPAVGPMGGKMGKDKGFGPPPGTLPEGVDPGMFNPAAKAKQSGAKAVQVPD